MHFTDIETLETGYGITLTDEERRLLASDVSQQLTTEDGRRVFKLKLALEPMQCPGCRGGVCRRSCLADYSLDGHPPQDGYVCPHCGASLTWWAALADDKQWFELAPVQDQPETEI
jgi:hypothetical protein